jgi:hypothetical protein
MNNETEKVNGIPQPPWPSIPSLPQLSSQKERMLQPPLQMCRVQKVGTVQEHGGDRYTEGENAVMQWQQASPSLPTHHQNKCRTTEEQTAPASYTEVQHAKEAPNDHHSSRNKNKETYPKNKRRKGDAENTQEYPEFREQRRRRKVHRRRESRHLLGM